MQIMYANQVIAKEPEDGGFDAIEGFEVEGEQQVQKARIWNAPFIKKISRGNRDLVMSGTVRLMPRASLKAAMLLREKFYSTLPDEGDLVKTVDGASATYSAAKLKSCKTVKDQYGVACGFELSFELSGPSGTYDPASSDTPIADPDGTPIVDPSGVPITDP